MATVPHSLLDVFNRWQASGFPPQPRFIWRPESWKRRLTQSVSPSLEGIDLAGAVESISKTAAQADKGSPDRIDRNIVTSLHAPQLLMTDNGSYDPQNVVTAFLAAMIWGYGSTGYGPYRTARVLTSDSGIVEHLMGIAATAQSSPEGGLKAFADVAANKGTANYLKYLGPAFGTKYLYFLTAASDVAETTPVMDAVVRRWLRSEAGVSVVTGRWKTQSYEQYLSSLDDWRGQLGPGRDGSPLERVDLEFLIFACTRGDDTTWNAPSESPTVDELLDLLQPDIEALADQSGSPEGPDLLRQLADWVAARELPS